MTRSARLEIMIRVLTILFISYAAGQDSFDVASIHESQARGMESVQVSPGSVIMRGITLRSCVKWAYHVMEYQVSGPGWMDFERFDIAAKSANGASEDRLRVMMRALLHERFGLELHRETKELPAYALVVAKGGPKFKESESDGEMDIQPDKGVMAVTVKRAQVPMLADILYKVVHAPVIDKTGLKGRYDVTIDIGKYISEKPPDSQMDVVSMLINGLESELGLKPESKKMPLELLVVDHVEKGPVEN